MGKGTARLPAAANLTESVLRALKALGGAGSNQQIEEFVVSDLGIDPLEASRLHAKSSPGGRTELGYRIAWAKTRLRREEKIVNRERRIWAIASK